MTIKDEILKKMVDERSRELNPLVEITKDMRKEIVNILTDSKKGKRFLIVSVSTTREDLNNPYWTVKEVRKKTWYRKAKFECNYRKGSLRRLLYLLHGEGIGAHVEIFTEGCVFISISLKSTGPYVYAMNQNHKEIEESL